MAINNLFDYFKDINAFGAGPDARARSLLDANLITPEAMKAANRRSIGTGIMTGLASYLAQPKNQGYGSVLPYLGKSYLAASQAAQAPFQGVADQYLMDTQIAENKLKIENQKRTKELENQLLNDPRVKDNPILRAAVFSNPEKVFEILNTPKKPLGQKERLAQLMTMDADPDQTLTKTQRAEMEAIKQILSVGSPTGQTFGGVNLPIAPEGYYYDKNPDGSLKLNEKGNPYVVPVAGSKVAVDREKEEKKEQVAQESKATIAGTVIVDAQRALDLIDQDDTTTGADAFALRKLPGTKAFALDQMVKSIQANIGIDKLLDIKRSGAGLGQVPQSQLEMLASVLGQLNTAQDKETVRYNVDRVLYLYSMIVEQAGGIKALEKSIEQSLNTPERKKLIEKKNKESELENTSGSGTNTNSLTPEENNLLKKYN